MNLTRVLTVLFITLSVTAGVYIGRPQTLQPHAKETYLRNIRHPETGELLWDTYGRGWTARLDALRDEIDLYMHHPDVELLQIFYGPEVLEFSPERVTVGRTQNGRIKYMARLF